MTASTTIDTQTMSSLFRNTAQRLPNREALLADNAHLTYAELDRRTDVLAAQLIERGAGRDTIVGTLLLDGLAMVELTIATAKVGATLLAMNWRLAPGELEYIMGDANPDLVFVSECFSELYRDAGGENPLVVIAGDPAGAHSPLGSDPLSDHVTPTHPEVTGNDRWYMLYTSGTTGRPKGCQHNQRGYFINVLSWLTQLGMTERDCLLSSSPLFHVHGFGTLLCALVAGARVVIPARELSVEDTLRLTVAEGVTVQHLWQNGEAYFEAMGTLQLAVSLRLVIAPGGVIPAEIVQFIASTLNADMRFIYGQTESGCWITMTGLEEQLAHPQSCGRAMPHLATRIVDDAGQDVAPGEIGELQIKGPTLTTGYLNLPDATAETIVDGWLHTGDLFRSDDEGFLYLTGRKKELIKTGGENVYPLEVDAVLMAHPEILDGCVAGVPDPRWGEAVKAFIVLTPESTLSRADIVAWCREHIAGYKRPRYIEFVDEIPRDFSQKIQRLRLAERATTPDQSVD